MRWRIGSSQNFLKGRLMRDVPPSPGQFQQAALSMIGGWIANPDGGGMNPKMVEQIRAHDHACTSLRFLWLPRRNGKTCPSDINTCSGPCGMMFFNEGLGMKFEECSESWHYYCACCAATVASCGCETT